MKKQLLSYLVLLLVFVEAVWFVSDPLRRDYFARQIPIKNFEHAVKREVYAPVIPLMISALLQPPSAPPQQEPVNTAAVSALPEVGFDLTGHGVNACFNPLTLANKASSEKIYRWVDKNGKVHFGDGDRARGNPSKPVSSSSHNISTLTVDVSFQQHRADQRVVNEVEFEARAIYRILAGILPRKLVRPVNLKVLVFNSTGNLKDYQRQAFTHQDKGTAYQKAQDAYAYVVVKRARFQGLRAMRHELVHALVTAMAGSVPQWLGEGLAQYIEQVQWNMNAALVEPDSDDITRSYLSLADTTRLMDLHHSHFQFSISRSENFRQSYALFFFLRSHSQGRRFIQQLFAHYRDWDCEDVASAAVAERFYPGGIKKLNDAYLKWRKHGRFPVQRL